MNELSTVIDIEAHIFCCISSESVTTAIFLLLKMYNTIVNIVRKIIFCLFESFLLWETNDNVDVIILIKIIKYIRFIKTETFFKCQSFIQIKPNWNRWPRACLKFGEWLSFQHGRNHCWMTTTQFFLIRPRGMVCDIWLKNMIFGG